jgi:hypothetical protein
MPVGSPRVAGQVTAASCSCPWLGAGYRARVARSFRLRQRSRNTITPMPMKAACGSAAAPARTAVDIPAAAGLTCPSATVAAPSTRLPGGQPPIGTEPLKLDTVARMMRLHPAVQAARAIWQALDVLTSHTWPAP